MPDKHAPSEGALQVAQRFQGLDVLRVDPRLEAKAADRPELIVITPQGLLYFFFGRARPADQVTGFEGILPQVIELVFPLRVIDIFIV
jgi:hypothetical protein